MKNQNFDTAQFKKGFAIIILVVVIVIVAGVAGYFVVRKGAFVAEQTPTSTPAQTKSPTPAPKDVTASWVKYTDPKGTYEIKYSSRWAIGTGESLFDGVGFSAKNANDAGFPAAEFGLIIYPPTQMFPGYRLPSFGQPGNPGDKVEPGKLQVGGYNADRYKITSKDGFETYTVVVFRQDINRHFVFSYHGINSNIPQWAINDSEMMISTFKFTK